MKVIMSYVSTQYFFFGVTLSSVEGREEGYCYDIFSIFVVDYC